MKTNEELAAALNMIVARLASRPQTSAEWKVIRDHLREAMWFSTQRLAFYRELELVKEKK